MFCILVYSSINHHQFRERHKSLPRLVDHSQSRSHIIFTSIFAKSTLLTCLFSLPAPASHSLFLFPVSHVLALLIVRFLIVAIILFSISSLPFSKSSSCFSYLRSLLLSQIHQMPTITVVSGIVTAQYIQNLPLISCPPLSSWKLKKVMEKTEAR